MGPLLVVKAISLRRRSTCQERLLAESYFSLQSTIKMLKSSDLTKMFCFSIEKYCYLITAFPFRFFSFSPSFRTAWVSPPRIVSHTDGRCHLLVPPSPLPFSFVMISSPYKIRFFGYPSALCLALGAKRSGSVRGRGLVHPVSRLLSPCLFFFTYLLFSSDFYLGMAWGGGVGGAEER